MHVRAHIPGQISGPLSSQAVPQLPALPQQNVSTIPSRNQSLGNPQTSWRMSPEIDSIRNCILENIVKICQQRSPTVEWEKLSIFARRLELLLFQNSSSKEEYMNINTLQQRLINIFQRLSSGKSCQRMGNIISSSSSSSSSVGTMVATPGMPQRSDTNSTAFSLDNSIVGSNGSSALVANSAGMDNLIPTANVAVGRLQCNSFNPSDGVLSNGYQQSFPPISGGSVNNIFSSSSLGSPTHSSQMIPTPGFSNSRSLSMKTSSGGGFSNVDSVTASPSQQSLRCIGGQNSHITQMVSGMRSDMHAKPSSYFVPDEVVNRGLGAVENNSQLMNGVAHSELYMNAPAYATSQMPLQQQQQMMQNGDGCTTNIADISGPGNLFEPSGNMEGVNPLGLQPNFNSDSPLRSHQQNVQLLQQASNIKSRFLDHSTKLNMAGSQPTHNHLSQPQQLLQRVQQQQYSNRPHQSIVQLVQNHHPHKLQNQQNKQLSKNQSLRQSELASNAQLTSTILGQVLSGHQVELRNEAVYHQMLDQYQFSDLQHQYHLVSAAEVESKGVDMLSQSAGSGGLHSPITQVSRQLQHGMQRQSQVAQIQNGFPGLTVGKSEISAAPVVNQPSAEQLMHENLIQQVMGQDEGQGTYLAAERSVNGQAVPLESSVGLQGSMRTLGRSNIQIPQSRKKEIYDQQRWLLLLLHAKRCSSRDGKCIAKYCVRARNLWKHMEKCIDIHCKYTYCCQTKKLLNHFSKCDSTTCALCVRIRCWISQQKPCAETWQYSSQRNLENVTLKTTTVAEIAKTTPKSVTSAFETSDSMEPSLKRVKLDNSSPSGILLEGDSKSASSSFMEESEERSLGTQQSELPVPAQPDTMEVEESTVGAPNAYPKKTGQSNGHDTGKSGMSKSEVELQILNDSAADVKQDHFPTQTGVDHTNQNIKQDTTDHTGVTKSGKPKIKGVSLTELFTPEQVRQHVVGLRQWVGQSKAKAEKKQVMGHSMSENSCQLCAVERLTFEPPPIYCTRCGVRVKRNGMYYTGAVGDTRHYFCIPCHNEARGETIEVDGTAIAKARLDKKKNDEETEEPWVQCDKCEAWQHQICALFNGKRNDGGRAEYTCPNCYIAEIGRGERHPLPQSTVLGAKDLPRTILSDHMEQWLFRKLKQERHERARAQSKSFDEVPGAEGLVIRVVSSVDKKVEVKQRFLEIFQEENYPSEFPYKSKVVLLFQKIEGVEVCLFGMYVQEFGSESQLPSQRCVYLSYLDSVKYFRPEVKTVTGEALRTFVYHEILIGYLEYCKKRGFTSCYIWACPPFKGEDYILYCHPEIQKTPKSDKLREWYLSMLRKAQKENIVVGQSNLYDHFFVPMGECKAKVTAARLPYFDGDYWPGAAEDIINQFRQEVDGKKQQKKGTTKMTITKRQLKAAAQADLSSNASKDALLMQKLGETIYHMKEDFIMVHLQHTCSHCYQLMVSGRRWICSRNCKNFQLCDKCYEAEQMLEERDRHPMNSKEKHILTSEDVGDVPEDTKDKDENLESEFFDTRQAFLGLCQGNHYQFDTLRRAKHSSMMVLYHLHNPTEPAYVTTCNICIRDIEAGQGWHCGTCPEFVVCNNCYQKDGGIDHPHKLTSPSTSDAQNKEARQVRVLQLRKMLDLLVHASQCRLKAQCLNPNCHKVKGLFRHGYLCKTRASGGCQLCRRMWNLMKLHAQGCNKSECPVPRCKDLREHLRRLQQQSESRRRAAVMEMMRQRAAEAAGNTD